MAYNFKKAYYGKNAARKRKNTVKAVKKGIKYAKQGYALATQVAKMAQMINAEKKRYTLTTTGSGISQCYGATSAGYLINDITPVPAQGTTSVTRNGASIRLHSSLFKMQIFHQSATTAPMKIQMYIVKIKGPYQVASTWITNAFQLNPFVLNAGSPAIIDINSNFNPDYFSGFQIIQKKTLYIPVDSYSGVQTIKTYNIPLRYKNHHVRFQADGSSTPSIGQIFLVLLADSGNSSGVTASTLTNVPVTAVNTGCLVDYQIQHYFYDN